MTDPIITPYDEGMPPEQEHGIWKALLEQERQELDEKKLSELHEAWRKRLGADQGSGFRVDAHPKADDTHPHPHIKLHLPNDGGHVRVDHRGVHCDGSITPEKAALAIMVAKHDYNGKCAINPNLPPEEKMMLLLAAQQQGVEITNFRPSAKAIADYEAKRHQAAAAAAAAQPQPPTGSPLQTPVTTWQRPWWVAQNQGYPHQSFNIGDAPEELKNFLDNQRQAKTASRTETLHLVRDHEKIIGALVERMVNAQYLKDPEDRIAAIQETLRAYKKGELLKDAAPTGSPAAHAKAKIKGETPDQRVAKIRNLIDTHPEAQKAINRHYQGLMEAFDKRTVSLHLLEPTAQAKVISAAVKQLVKANSDFHSKLGSGEKPADDERADNERVREREPIESSETEEERLAREKQARRRKMFREPGPSDEHPWSDNERDARDKFRDPAQVALRDQLLMQYAQADERARQQAARGNASSRSAGWDRGGYTPGGGRGR